MLILDSPRSGSYAGLTSSRNRFGQYVRTRATPVNPSSTFQQQARTRFTLNAQNWRDLTAGQRAGWNDLGNMISRTNSLGTSYTLTGFMAYMEVNINNQNAGNAIVADAPIYLPPDPLLTITPTIAAASFSIAYTATPLPAGARLFLSASPQRSAGRGFEGDYRLIAVSAAAAASPFVALTNYTARFGVPVTGNRIFIAGQTYLGGFLSTPLLASVVVS